MDTTREIEDTRRSQAAIAVVQALHGYRGYSLTFSVAASGMPAVLIHKGDKLVSGVSSESTRTLYRIARSEIRCDLQRGA